MTDSPYDNLSEYKERFALCIGINKYKNYSPLKHAVDDALEVSKVLTRFGNFKVKTLVDNPLVSQHVTLTQIEDGIDWLFKKATSKNTLLLLYYSGHSVGTPSGQLCLLPGDAKLENGEVKYFDTLRFEGLRHQIENTSAGALVILLDTCYSEASSFLPNGARTPFNFKLHMIGASQIDQEANESVQAQHGVFTHYLLEAFELLKSITGWLDSDQLENYIRIESAKANWSQKTWPLKLGGPVPLVKVGYSGKESNISEEAVNPTPVILTRREPAYYPTPRLLPPGRTSKSKSYIYGIFASIFSAVVFGAIIIGAFLGSGLITSSSQISKSVPTSTAIPAISVLPPAIANQIIAAPNLSLVSVPLNAAIKMPTSSRLYAVTFLPNDNKRFVAIAEDGTVSEWLFEPDAAQSNVVTLITAVHITEPTNPKLQILSKALAVSPDGKTVAVAKTNGFSILNLQDKLKVISASKFADEHKARVEGISFSPNGKTLASVSSDQFIKIWDVSKPETPRLVKSIKGNASYTVTFIDGSTIATGDGDGKIRFWNINTGVNIFSNSDGIFMHKASWAYWIAIAPVQNGGNLLIASVSGYTKDTTPSPSQKAEIKLVLVPLTLFSQGSATLPQPLTIQELVEEKKLTEWIYSTSFSPDGNYLAVAYGSGNIKIWNTSTLELVKDTVVSSNSGGKRVTTIAFSPDGQWLVAGNDIGELFAWNINI